MAYPTGRPWPTPGFVPTHLKGVRLPYEMDGGGVHWKFWKGPLGGTKILFCEHGLNFFYIIVLHLTGTNSVLLGGSPPLPGSLHLN